MHHSESTFTAGGEVELYSQSWEGDTVRARVAVVHGVLEHGGRYAMLAEHLVTHGFACHSYDQRGHGRSPGRRGHVTHFSDYLDDLRLFLSYVKRKGDEPVFLYGHSMGALIVLRYLLDTDHTVSGAVVSGAPLEPVGIAKPHLVALARLLTLLWPTWRVGLNLTGENLTRDVAMQQAYRADRLIGGSVTVRWGTENLDAVAYVKKHPALLRVPTLFVHGGADRLNAAGAVAKYVEGLPLSDKRLMLYPGGCHEPHNDLCRDQVFSDVVSWIEGHLAPVAGSASVS